MKIGVPKEIKNHEYRVGLVPGSVRELVNLLVILFTFVAHVFVVDAIRRDNAGEQLGDGLGHVAAMGKR